MNEAAIWYLPSADVWWMEPVNPVTVRTFLATHIDAIRVTNARLVLRPEFVAQLARAAGR